MRPVAEVAEQEPIIVYCGPRMFSLCPLVEFIHNETTLLAESGP